VVAYAAEEYRHERSVGRMLGLLCGFVAAMELLVVAADFLSLLFGWELVGAFSWALIAYDWRDPDRPRRAAQAFITTRLGDLGLYLAAGAALASSGGRSLAFNAMPRVATTDLAIVGGGLLFAAAAKSAQLPFSPWLFSAMAGPTPVSALLHSATMVAAGAYALARLGPAMRPLGWWSPAVAALGVATALAGGVVALVQTDLKKALAASTSAQYGLILVAVGAGSSSAAAAHLLTHAAFKSLLFLGAGVAMTAAGTLDLARMRLGRAEPTVAVLFGIGAVFLAAVPPLGAAFSKEQILGAAASYSLWLAAGVAFAGLLSAAYAARLWLLAFGPGPTAAPDGRGWRPGRVQVGAMGLLAAYLAAIWFLWLPAGRHLVRDVTGQPLRSDRLWEETVSFGVVMVAGTAVWVADRRGQLYRLGFSPVAQARVAERVIDAGVRAAAAIAAGFSRVLSWWAERSIDDVVIGVANATLAVAARSRVTDERVVDAAVEGLAEDVGIAGRRAQRLQSGLTHRYYVLVAVGAAVAVAVAALGRS
jgi:NADH:ubiquinone oxidoreductase subunit 5 (subunit L)/multisubunit Na+/H+ antiporter MnhA subunit